MLRLRRIVLVADSGSQGFVRLPLGFTMALITLTAHLLCTGRRVADFGSASDPVIDEQPLFVEPGDAFGVAVRDLLAWDSPCGDADRVAEGTALASSVNDAYWSSPVWAMTTTSAGIVSTSASTPPGRGGRTCLSGARRAARSGFSSASRALARSRRSGRKRRPSGKMTTAVVESSPGRACGPWRLASGPLSRGMNTDPVLL